MGKTTEDQDKNYMGSSKWVITIAGSLFALIAGVFLVGWNARGQTAAITAVEIKTETMQETFNLKTGRLREDFDIHCVSALNESKEFRNTLSALKENASVQTVILSNIEKKLK